MEKPSADLEAGLKELRKELKDSKAEVSKAKKISVSFKAPEAKIASSEKNIEEVIENSLVACLKLKDSADSVVNG